MKQNDVMQTLHHNGHKQKIDIETCINLCVTFSNVHVDMKPFHVHKRLQILLPILPPSLF